MGIAVAINSKIIRKQSMSKQFGLGFTTLSMLAEAA